MSQQTCKQAEIFAVLQPVRLSNERTAPRHLVQLDPQCELASIRTDAPELDARHTPSPPAAGRYQPSVPRQADALPIRPGGMSAPQPPRDPRIVSYHTNFGSTCIDYAALPCFSGISTPVSTILRSGKVSPVARTTCRPHGAKFSAFGGRPALFRVLQFIYRTSRLRYRHFCRTSPRSCALHVF